MRAAAGWLAALVLLAVARPTCAARAAFQTTTTIAPEAVLGVMVVAMLVLLLAVVGIKPDKQRKGGKRGPGSSEANGSEADGATTPLLAAEVWDRFPWSCIGNGVLSAVPCTADLMLCVRAVLDCCRRELPQPPTATATRPPQRLWCTAPTASRRPPPRPRRRLASPTLSLPSVSAGRGRPGERRARFPRARSLNSSLCVLPRGLQACPGSRGPGSGVWR